MYDNELHLDNFDTADFYEFCNSDHSEDITELLQDLGVELGDKFAE